MWETLTNQRQLLKNVASKVRVSVCLCVWELIVMDEPALSVAVGDSKDSDSGKCLPELFE